MGGEKLDPLTVVSSVPGSPPRGRGKVFGLVSYIPCFGITPAWAGKRCVRHNHSYQQGDHPRVGGEKPNAPASLVNFLGSPPRGRGKAFVVDGENERYRITPAWAGKSNGLLSVRNTCRDHPRVGGEKPFLSLDRFLIVGSPPRGRGKAAALPLIHSRPGITPAWAGKRIKPCNAIRRKRDHPRVGGEKLSRSRPGTRPRGSPPRGRGKAGTWARLMIGIRITPAWAGKSTEREREREQHGDHPRVGGEKLLILLGKIREMGSPPRGRGKAYRKLRR